MLQPPAYSTCLFNPLISKIMPLVTLLIPLALLAFAVGAVRHVPAGQVHSLHRLGRPQRLLPAGLHLILPLLDRIGHRIDLAGRVLHFEEPLNEACGVRGKVYWQVLEPERAAAVIDQADQLIRRGTLAALRDEAEPSRADRRDLGGRLKQTLNHTLRERGMMVTRVELDFG